MSQIFDALIRSESERTGTDPKAQAEATELLQYVERQSVPAWTSVALVDRPGQDNDVQGDLPSRNEMLSAEMEAIDGPSPPEMPSLAEHTDVLNQFQSLSITLSDNSRLVSLTDPESAPAEAFRLLSVRLRDIRQTRPLKRVLITSSTPREGKSTLAANLGCALARNGSEKVLVIEGDLRKPALAQMFELGHMPGICEWVQEENGPSGDGNIYRLKEANLWILPAGKCTATPLGVLQSTSLPLLLEQLEQVFDWIIIDTPPILPLADTSVWARMADGILLVTRRGTTERKQLTAALQAIDHEKLIGALLNCSKSSVYSRYYYSSSSVA